MLTNLVKCRQIALLSHPQYFLKVRYYAFLLGENDDTLTIPGAEKEETGSDYDGTNRDDSGFSLLHTCVLAIYGVKYIMLTTSVEYIDMCTIQISNLGMM